MPDSPRLAGQRLLDNLPVGCELETSTRPVGREWEATASIINPYDTTRPVYLARGASEAAALRRAIAHCAAYWAWRGRGRGSNC